MLRLVDVARAPSGDAAPPAPAAAPAAAAEPPPAPARPGRVGETRTRGARVLARITASWRAVGADSAGR